MIAAITATVKPMAFRQQLFEEPSGRGDVSKPSSGGMGIRIFHPANALGSAAVARMSIEDLTVLADAAEDHQAGVALNFQPAPEQAPIRDWILLGDSA